MCIAHCTGMLCIHARLIMHCCGKCKVSHAGSGAQHIFLAVHESQADRQTWGALLLFSTLSSTAVPRPKVRPTTRLAPKTYRNLAKIANTVVLCSFMSFPRACTQSQPGCAQKRVQLRLQKQLKLASTKQASIVWSSDGALHLSVSNEECSQWPVDDSQAVLARSCDGQTLGACTVWLWNVTPGHAVLCLHV